jgi:type IV secretion system protein VirB8
MTPDSQKAAAAHYAAAESWANDRMADIEKSRRTAWIVAIIATLVTLALSAALMLLTPLKTVVPYTLLVDRQTGHVQALKPLETERIAPSMALTQSFLVQYVIAREGFDFATIKNDYRKVMLLSADGAESGYNSAIQISNPESPLNRFARGTGIGARVLSVSPLAGNTALVRFETSERDKSGQERSAQNWVAVIGYRYSNAPMAIEERYVNPLGFEVTRYRRDAEAPPEVPDTPQIAPNGQPLTTDPVTPSKLMP